MSVRICWPRKDGIQEVSVALPLRSISTLHKEVARQFGSGLPSRDFVLTDTVTDVATDDEVALLRDGTTLLLTFQQDRRLTGAATEKISFQPHPKTLTMAGDYEYFAAQVGPCIWQTFKSQQRQPPHGPCLSADALPWLRAGPPPLCVCIG